MSIPPLPAEGATSWVPWAQGIDEAARAALTADAAVAAVEDATTVAPTGQWDFDLAPTVNGVALGSGGGGGAVASVNGQTGTVVLAASDVGAATPTDITTASAADRARANHTGTQTSASISDLTEAVQDIVGAFFGAGTGATVTYNDAANTITVSATGTTDPEAVRDAIGAAMVGVGNISVTVNDALDTITISTTATVNSTDAALRDRSTHTGTQAAATITGLAAVATTGAKADVGLGAVDNTSDASKPVSTAQQTALDAKPARTLTKRTVTGAYTLVAADATDMVLHSTAASAVTVTLPQDSAVTISQEVAIPWRQYGAGQITFAAGTGATLVSRGSVFKSAGQYAEGVLTKTAANVWLLSGDIVA